MIDGRAIVIGETPFTVKVIEFLLKMRVPVAAVFGRDSKEENSDNLKAVARKHRLLRHDAEDINAQTKAIQSYHPDVIYCVGFRRLLKKPILDICPVIGFHPSPLPVGRGRSPVFWALDLGWKQTAATWFVIDEGCDTGDILRQRFIDIAPNDTPASLTEHLESVGIADLAALDLSKRRKQDNAKATYFAKRTPKNCRWIPWGRT